MNAEATVQRKADASAGDATGQSLGEINAHAAKAGVAGGGAALPHLDQIQRSFGKHDVSGVSAHVGGDAANASTALGAEAYATGNNVAFAKQPDLHTAAHEAAHVVQQREGVATQKGVGAANDAHEQHADKVADKVVAGESAEPLLDAATGGRANGVAAPPSGDIIQRKAVDDVKTKALTPINKKIGGGIFNTPLANEVYFSGPKAVSLVHTPIGPGQAVQQAFDKIVGPTGRVDHGTNESAISGSFPSRFPELYNDVAFNWKIGSQTSYEYPEAHPVKTYFEKLVYPDDQQGPWTVHHGFAYERKSTEDVFSTEVDISNNVLAKVLNGTITGAQQLKTQADAHLFGKWTTDVVNDPFRTILGNLSETDAFINALKPTGVAGLKNWYAQIRSAGLFDGLSPRAWIDTTFPNEELQLGVIRSLQSLYKNGVTDANKDMDMLVDAFRVAINDKKVDKTKKTILQNRLVNSYMWGNLVLDADEVPDRPTATQDTPDANFDVVRLAGKIVAQRKLLPTLQAAFDPVAYAKAYPVESQAHLGTDMTRLVISDAQHISTKMQTFLDSDLTPETLGPACFGPDGVCGPNSKKHGGLELSQYDLAMGTAKLGAVEAMKESAIGIGSGDSSITAHLGAHQAFINISAKYAPMKSVNQKVGHVANEGVTSLSDALYKDHEAVVRAAEALDMGNNENNRRRAAGLERFGTLITDYRTTKDLAALRKEVKETRIEDGKDTSIKTIQGLAHSQAAAAKTEANLAYSTAHDRYSGDFMENLNGLFEEKTGGAKWQTVGMLALNARKEMLDVMAALNSAKPLVAAAGPVLGVIMVGLDAIFTVHDWWAKAKLTKAKKEMTARFKTLMDQGEKETLGKIQSLTTSEVSMIAQGKVRPAAGSEAYMNTLGQGKNATPAEPIELSDLSKGQLDKFYQGMVANPGVPHSDVYALYLGGIGVKGNEMWATLQREIEDLPGTWK